MLQSVQILSIRCLDENAQTDRKDYEINKSKVMTKKGCTTSRGEKLSKFLHEVLAES